MVRQVRTTGHSLGAHPAMMTQALAMRRGIAADVLSIGPYNGNDAAAHAVAAYHVDAADFVRHTTQIRAFPPTAVSLISNDASQLLYGRELMFVSPSGMREGIGDSVSERHRYAPFAAAVLDHVNTFLQPAKQIRQIWNHIVDTVTSSVEISRR